MPEWQDPAWREREKLPSWREALAALHAPTGEADLSPWRGRVAAWPMTNFWPINWPWPSARPPARSHPGPRIPAGPLADAAEKALPFRLTGAQIRALSEVRGDLASGDG